MSRAELLTELRRLRPWLAERGVSGLQLFGSFARDEAGPESDIDLIVSFDRVPGLSFFSLQHDLSERLGRPVELCTAEVLHPLVKSRIEAEAVVV
jgi:predicted nucleotidyltransferase